MDKFSQGRQCISGFEKKKQIMTTHCVIKCVRNLEAQLWRALNVDKYSAGIVDHTYSLCGKPPGKSMHLCMLGKVTVYWSRGRDL